MSISNSIYCLTDDIIYWIDRDTQKIEQSYTNGTDRKVLLTLTGPLDPDPFGLVLLGDYLYWTDWRLKGLGRVNRVNTSDVSYIGKRLFLGLNDVKLVPSEKPGKIYPIFVSFTS